MAVHVVAAEARGEIHLYRDRHVVPYERLSEPDLRQAATIMAIFVYNAAQRDAMMPRMLLPNPPFDHQQDKPLEGIYPTAAAK